MAKGLRQIEADLRLVDLVMLVMDARIPRSSRHPQLEALMTRRNKPVVLVLNKADMAEPSVTAEWIRVLRAADLFPVKASMASGEGVNAILKVMAQARARVLERAHKAGRVDAAARMLVAGIPNVGKSSLINRIAPRGRARVGKRPGVTRGRQWITLPGGIEMMDSPGILFPRIEAGEMFLNLAAVGAIREENLPLLDVADHLASLLEARGLIEPPTATDESRLDGVARRRGMLLPGGVPDAERAAHFLLKHTREGRWGPLSLEAPEARDRVVQEGACPEANLPRD